MRTSEHIIVARSKELAVSLLRKHFINYRKKYAITKWSWKVTPEAQKYDGKSKVLIGKWRAYGRISFE